VHSIGSGLILEVHDVRIEDPGQGFYVAQQPEIPASPTDDVHGAIGGGHGGRAHDGHFHAPVGEAAREVMGVVADAAYGRRILR